MLNLAKKQLSHEWIIVTDGAADLSIYSLDSEDGRQAWQRHGDGASALLSASETTNEAVDLILKKPLRSKNFSTALNTISDNLSNAEVKVVEASPAVSAIPKVKKKSPSLLRTLSKHFKTKNKPAKDLPALNLTLPKLEDTEPDTILKPSQLQKWLSDLTTKDSASVINDILGNLLPLNRGVISTNKRLELLEIYRQPIHKLLFDCDPRYVDQDHVSHTDYLQAIHALNLLIKELAIGYQIIVDEAYQQGLRPQSNTLFLSAIIRLAETSSFSILHAFHYYLSPPKEVVACLHQLYRYCEASTTLHAQNTSKDEKSSVSFAKIYNQIMLTAIADPYRLTQTEILNLYKLMARYADNVSIYPILESNGDRLTSGHFYLDFASDKLPSSLVNIPDDKRHISSAKLLDTQPVLKAIELDLNPESNSVIQHDTKVPDLQFLRKITPQINATYERQFKRVPTKGNSKLSLALGIKMITQGLNNHGDRSQFSQWTIHNRGMGGMMLSCHGIDCYQLNIGDFVGIFETNKVPTIAIIRWLHSDNGSTSMGLENHHATPVAITVTTDKSDISSGLLLSNDKNMQIENTVIVDKHIYSADLRLQIKERDKTYIVTLDKLIERSVRYEQFSFKLQASS